MALPGRAVAAAPRRRASGEERPASIFSGRSLDRDERVLVALTIGVAAAIAALLVFVSEPRFVAKDFTYPWRAARALLAGLDPYRVIRPSGPYPFESYFPYPLTAALVGVPFAPLPAAVGGALFFGLATGALAYALTRGGMGRLWLFCSPSFAMAAALGQWSPLVMAAALLTPLAWALTSKPTLGAALFLYRPSWRALWLALAFVALSLLVLPRWPLEWLEAARHTPHHFAPVLRPFGVLALVALVRWRAPEGRLVAAMACVPQNLYFYDQLPLWLAARSGRAAAALTASSWVAFAAVRLTCRDPFFCGREAEPWVIGLIYLPAALIVLLEGRRRPDAADPAADPAAAGSVATAGPER
jgi:MFS family permease